MSILLRGIARQHLFVTSVPTHRLRIRATPFWKFHRNISATAYAQKRNDGYSSLARRSSKPKKKKKSTFGSQFTIKDMQKLSKKRASVGSAATKEFEAVSRSIDLERMAASDEVNQIMKGIAGHHETVSKAQLFEGVDVKQLEREVFFTQEKLNINDANLLTMQQLLTDTWKANITGALNSC